MKKIGILILILVICLGIFLFHNNHDISLGDANHIVGDVNGDGSVTASDYLLIKKHLLNTSKLTGDELTYADVNGDGNINASDYVAIKKIILYGPTTRTVTATFTVQDTNAATTTYNSKSCTINRGESSCEIVIPQLTAKEGYTVIGWNVIKDATVSTVNQNSTIKISGDTNYYSITRNDKPLKALFDVLVKADKSGEDQICYRYNGSGSCIVKAPVIIPNAGYQAEGWADLESEEIVVKSGGSFLIKEDGLYYSVVKKEVVVTFNENENISNSDMSKTNIKADKLSFYSTSCISYNDEGCKIAKVPIIYSKGNRSWGFSLTSNGDIVEVQRKVFTENTTLYARVRNYAEIKNKRITVGNYSISQSKVYGNIVVEFEDKITDNDYIDYIYFYLDLLYKEHPELFYFNGKMIILSKETYSNVYDAANASNYAGMTHSYRGYSFIHIKYNPLSSVSKKHACFTITHEMGHAYDYAFYQIKNALIRDRDAIKNAYKKYLSAESKPFRPYSFNLGSTANLGAEGSEFVADLFAYGTVRDFSIKKIVEYRDDGIAYRYVYIPDTSYDMNNYITTELYNLYLDFTKEGKNYYKEVGIIQ